ncbi:hypothetical protein P5G51_013560 [Virgibacillus sp. 179-BFC.A HS]|uniref:Uncharacterized protein n=1 Tax=Tigheibacillus jepli TaxID=3035914 RepID=A0ABU5CLA7_9BACI|nr:hypothetical protein [Virgibacillus sp. 179-BFC.A HS]MDY0406283.1 hypothetical protein [Virgibacillus sp. 179-BFC.A HS]
MMNDIEIRQMKTIILKLIQYKNDYTPKKKIKMTKTIIAGGVPVVVA